MRSNRRLQDEFELRGEFWRPEDPADRLRGILRYEAGRTELSLLGVFGDFVGEGDDAEAKAIVGLTDAGYCTLSQPIRIHAPSESIELPSHGATLSIRFSFLREGDLFRSMTWSQDAAFEFAADTPQPVDWFLQQVTHLRALLGLLRGEAVTPTSISGSLSEPESPDIAIFFAVVGQTPDRKLYPAEMILSRDRLGDSFAERRWSLLRNLVPRGASI